MRKTPLKSDSGVAAVTARSQNGHPRRPAGAVAGGLFAKTSFGRSVRRRPVALMQHTSSLRRLIKTLRAAWRQRPVCLLASRALVVGRGGAARHRTDREEIAGDAALDRGAHSCRRACLLRSSDECPPASTTWADLHQMPVARPARCLRRAGARNAGTSDDDDRCDHLLVEHDLDERRKPVLGYGTVTVNHGATLTVQPGVIVKLSNSTAAQLLMSGVKLNAAGTAANPIVFSSIADDSVGGDTGGDGPTTGSAGTWCNLAFTNSGSNVGLSSSLSYATVRYAGRGSGTTAINMITTSGNPGPKLTLSNTTITASGAIGISDNGSTLTIEDSSVDHNGGDGIKVTGTNGSAAISHT